MKLLLLLILAIAVFPAYTQNDIRIETTYSQNRPKALSMPLDLGYDFLKTDSHIIQPSLSSYIVAPQGTRIEFAENSFVNQNGDLVESKIKISVKEAIEPSDIVLSSLTTMTSSGEILQTKGMIEVKATSEGEEVFLAKNKAMKILMPVGFEDGYQYYEGVDKGDEVKWTNPKLIERQDDELVKRVMAMRRGSCGRRPAIMYAKVGQELEGRELKSVTVHFKEGPTKFLKESYLIKDGKKAGLTKDQAETVEQWFLRNRMVARELTPYGEYGKDVDKLKMVIDIEKAKLLFRQNAAYIDPEMVNIFEMKNLGWANIDRLAKFPEAEKMKLMVEQKTISEVDSLNLTLVVPSANVFIPGSIKEDGNYAFNSGPNQSEISMPKNEKAFIVAIASKDGQKYFDLKEISLGQNEIESLNLRAAGSREIAIAVKNTF